MRYRLAELSDLHQCAGLLPRAFSVTSPVRARLPELWRALIEVNPANVVVIDDVGRIEGCAISAHVGGEFVERSLREPQPYLSALFYEEMLAGRSPLLSAAEVVTANRSGNLNLLVLHFGLRNHDLSDASSRAVLRAGSQAFYFFNSGYRYGFLLQEVYGRQAADYMQAGGFRLLHEFDKYGHALAERPFWFGLRKEWASRGAVNEMGFLFDPPAPRFGFTHAERRVLLRALLSQSDAGIAAALGVSLDAVKKTWRRAFDRAAAAAPHLFVLDAVAVTGAREQGRGFEKRRYLLDHLRTHLEELRPYDTDTR
jgi:hypothetical protein